MKKVTLVLVVLFLVGILAGCGQTGEKWEALTEEELSYFNWERNFLIIMKIAAISF